MTRLSVTRIVGGYALRVMQGAQWAERIVATSPQMIVDYITEHWPSGTQADWNI